MQETEPFTTSSSIISFQVEKSKMPSTKARKGPSPRKKSRHSMATAAAPASSFRRPAAAAVAAAAAACKAAVTVTAISGGVGPVSAFVPGRDDVTAVPTTSRYFSNSPNKGQTDDMVSSKETDKRVSNVKSEGTKSNPKNIERTKSFQPVWHGSLSAHLQSVETDTNDPNGVDVHTLILGTHPSIASLSESQYFGHTQNAFWWIAGDCLGFRRKKNILKADGKPYKLAEYLRYDESKVLPYDEQVKLMTSKGFALWDLIKACEREGSLDQDIKNEEPNDIRGFCEMHPTVKRIVLANGGTGCTQFSRHFKDWFLSNQLKPGDNEESVKAFAKKFAKKTDNFKGATIEVISALPVSPAAAKYSYTEKRDSWERYVYAPGLRDNERLQEVKAKSR